MRWGMVTFTLAPPAQIFTFPSSAQSYGPPGLLELGNQGETLPPGSGWIIEKFQDGMGLASYGDLRGGRSELGGDPVCLIAAEFDTAVRVQALKHMIVASLQTTGADQTRNVVATWAPTELSERC